MTRKDYIRLADALAESRPDSGTGRREQWAADVAVIADALKADNGRFDRGRFESYIANRAAKFHPVVADRWECSDHGEGGARCCQYATPLP
jgi:hypothetical protein